MIRQVIWRKFICGKVDKQKLVIVYFNQPHFPCLMCGYLPKKSREYSGDYLVMLGDPNWDCPFSYKKKLFLVTFFSPYNIIFKKSKYLWYFFSWNVPIPMTSVNSISSTRHPATATIISFSHKCLKQIRK